MKLVYGFRNVLAHFFQKICADGGAQEGAGNLQVFIGASEHSDGVHEAVVIGSLFFCFGI